MLIGLMIASYQLSPIHINMTLTIINSKVENIHKNRVLSSTFIKRLFSIAKSTG